MERVGIIGMGNMGSKYAVMIAEGKVDKMQLAAVTRIHQERYEEIKDVLPKGLKIYQSGDDLFDAIDSKEIELDTIIVVTPHYSHETFAIKAFERGLNVLCDKPAGVYSRQARNMMEACNKARETNPDIKYGYIFHQRTFPVHIKMREIVKSERYGKIRRVNWIASDWYRTDAYYKSSPWRATWSGDGGGTILNQCPHNIDLLQWICGMPSDIQAFCHEGKYHDIEVEDEVTAYMEWENGATGVFIASTGEAAGVNRFEISMDDALLVCERGKLRVLELDMPETEYQKNTTDLFVKPKSEWKDIEVPSSDDYYIKVLKSFADGIMIADGDEAIDSMYIANAIYLSSWEKKKIHIPEYGSDEEREFETSFEKWLNEKSGKN